MEVNVTRPTCETIAGSSPDDVAPVMGDLATVDLDRLDDALDACNFLLEHMNADGAYEVEERWGPEGESYLIEVGWTLLEAYRITGQGRYLEGAVSILDRLKRTQMPDGGWTLKLGTSGLEFKVTEEERQRTWEREELPLIGAAAYAVAKYRRLTSDQAYDGMINRAVDHLLEHWDPKRGCFLESSRHFTEMRSAPTGYQAFFLFGLSAWQPQRTDLDDVVPGLVDYVQRNLESFDEQTMPFMRMVHIALLLQHRPIDHVRRELKPRIDDLAASPVFKCSWVRGGYGHRDSYAGIVTSKANVRGSGAVALVMRLYDLTTGTRTYRDSEVYGDVSWWIDAMKADRGYYGFQTREGLKRLGRGSPAQYIPCFWIFGAF
jgi:hypothetical protein